MAQIDVDYDRVQAVASRLNNEGGENGELVTTLKTLLSHVTELLTGAGGLWLQQSSPMMSAQYTEFNASLTAAIANMIKFAESFNGIAQNLKDLDSALATPPQDGN
jgi:uncharacterized protein YukE